jgi:hypothetical protein
MVATTRKQREALKGLYFRGLYPSKGISYKAFRKTCLPEPGGYGAVMVPWLGIWIGVERDGYAHS